VTGWFVVAGPKGMPAPVVAKLQSALKATLNSPEFRRQLEDGGGVPASDSEDVVELVKMETARYKTIAK
jgi:tripartite-type tricarboxylate transporter receptor subunit TctC